MNFEAEEKAKKEAEERAKIARDNELNDLRTVLKTPAGRRVFWRLLEHCRPFQTVWEQSAKIHYNAGRQDVGHYLLSEIETADQEALFIMMRESKGAA